MNERRFENVWDAIEDSPAMAANLRMRSDLITATRNIVAEWGIPSEAAADLLGLTEGRFEDLMCGRINELSLDDLAEIAVRAGLELRLEVERPAA